jgi:pimeloyl-ACP methyl ester carboxylesterase
LLRWRGYNPATTDAPPVQYARTSDGFDIAYTVAGEGTPFLFTPAGMSHVQLEWKLPNTSPWFAGLSQRFRLVHFDGRGQGMSDRSLDRNFSHEDRLRDLSAVIEKLGLHGFVLMGLGHTAHTAVRYACHYPQLVKALVLLNTAVSLKPSAVSLQIDLARHDWSLFLNSLAAGGRLPPDVQQSVLDAFHEMTLPGDWLVALAAFAKSDIPFPTPARL